jgi:hypothetical protein
MSRHIKETIEVGIDRPLPIINRKIFKGTLWTGDTRVIHQQIEALMPSAKCAKSAVDLLGVRDITYSSATLTINTLKLGDMMRVNIKNK